MALGICYRCMYNYHLYTSSNYIKYCDNWTVLGIVIGAILAAFVFCCGFCICCCCCKICCCRKKIIQNTVVKNDNYVRHTNSNQVPNTQTPSQNITQLSTNQLQYQNRPADSPLKRPSPINTGNNYAMNMNNQIPQHQINIVPQQQYNVNPQ